MVEDHKDTDAQKLDDKKAVKDKETNEYLSKMRSRQADKIPLKFDGKGAGGYILYDVVHHRGHSAPRVTRQFEDLVRHNNGPNESFCNARVLKRHKVGGPRFAVMNKEFRKS